MSQEVSENAELWGLQLGGRDSCLSLLLVPPLLTVAFPVCQHWVSASSQLLIEAAEGMRRGYRHDLSCARGEGAQVIANVN